MKLLIVQLIVIFKYLMIKIVVVHMLLKLEDKTIEGLLSESLNMRQFYINI